MAPEQVIVTIQTESGSFSGDYELPANIPAGRLSKLLLEALVQRSPQQFGHWKGLELVCGGSVLSEKETLTSRSIWDGSVVNIREG